MSEESGKVKVFPVLRECRGCALIRKDTGCSRSGAVCCLCASLVRTEDGSRFVYARPILNGADGFDVDRSQLSPAPKVLQ